MMTNISWPDYLMIIVPLFFLYYGYIGFQYYFDELKSFTHWDKLLASGITRRAGNGDSPIHPIQVSTSNVVDAVPGTDTYEELGGDLKLEIENLHLKLKEAVETASLQKDEKTLLDNLGTILIEYPEFRNSPFQSTISELIMTECRRYGSIILSEDAVVKLWDGV